VGPLFDLLPAKLTHALSEAPLLVEPWVDYNGQSRFSILEINGVEAPQGKFADNMGEYQPPSEPTGAPWDHVISWQKGWLALGAGDYAVVAFQYRLGDGEKLDRYPDVMARTLGLQLSGIFLQTKSTEMRWPEKAKEEWSNPALMMRTMSNPAAAAVGGIIMWDMPYVLDYYKPVWTLLSHYFSFLN
jgi:hypothetical protein